MMEKGLGPEGVGGGRGGGECILKIVIAKGGGVQFSYVIVLGGGEIFDTSHFSENPRSTDLGRNFLTTSRVNSLFISHAGMQR